MTSFLGVPVVSQGEVYGNLRLTDKTTAEVFTDLDEQLASGLAPAAGIVINNARLHGHVRRRDAALTAVHEVVAAVAGERKGRAALQLAADRACVLAGADVTTVALPAEGGDTLEVTVAAGTASVAFDGVRFPAAGSVSGEVIATGRPVVLADASLDHRIAQPQVRNGHIGPAMWVPLMAYGGPVGTVAVGRARQSPPFTDAELDLLQLFAAHARVIVEVDRSRDDARRLSILEDQERIARDLHDIVIQRLFATGLSLQSLCRLTDEPTTSRIAAAIDELDGNDPSDPDGDLRARAPGERTHDGASRPGPRPLRRGGASPQLRADRRPEWPNRLGHRR